MSRTYRQPPHWANAQLIDILRDLPKDTSKSAIKWLNAAIRRCRGQDGNCTSYINDPSNKSPKGYGYSGAVGLNGKPTYLVCFCKPQDCHGDIIKKFICERLKKSVGESGRTVP